MSVFEYFGAVALISGALAGIYEEDVPLHDDTSSLVSNKVSSRNYFFIKPFFIRPLSMKMYSNGSTRVKVPST